MTFVAALLLLAQTAAGVAATEPPASASKAGRASSGGAVASATASARIIQPVSVRVRGSGEAVEVDAGGGQKPQTERDRSGTLWIEFS